MRFARLVVPITIAALNAACGAAPPAVAPKPPSIAAAQKISWILRMEDERILRDPAPPAPVEPAVRRAGAQRRRALRRLRRLRPSSCPI